MSFRPLLFVAVVSVVSGIAAADEFKPPPMKMVSARPTARRPSKGKPCLIHRPRDVSIERAHEVDAVERRDRKKNACTSAVTQPSPNTYVEESRCAKGPNAGSVTKIIYTYQGDTASRTEMHVNDGKSETVMVMDAKYLGSCPAGMKPGDVVMPDGKKIAVGS